MLTPPTLPLNYPFDPKQRNHRPLRVLCVPETRLEQGIDYATIEESCVVGIDLALESSLTLLMHANSVMCASLSTIKTSSEMRRTVVRWAACFIKPPIRPRSLLKCKSFRFAGRAGSLCCSSAKASSRWGRERESLWDVLYILVS